MIASSQAQLRGMTENTPHAVMAVLQITRRILPTSADKSAPECGTVSEIGLWLRSIRLWWSILVSMSPILVDASPDHVREHFGTLKFFGFYIESSNALPRRRTRCRHVVSFFRLCSNLLNHHHPSFAAFGEL